MRRRSGGIMGAFWLQLAFQTAAVATAAAAAAAADRSADADASACHFMINDAEADAFLFTGAADLHDDALVAGATSPAALLVEEFAPAPAMAPAVLEPEPGFDFLAGLDAAGVQSSDWLYLE